MPRFIFFLQWTTAVCTANCNNHGTCVSPDICSCNGNYTGRYCATRKYFDSFFSAGHFFDLFLSSLCHLLLQRFAIPRAATVVNALHRVFVIVPPVSMALIVKLVSLNNHDRISLADCRRLHLTLIDTPLCNPACLNNGLCEQHGAIWNCTCGTGWSGASCATGTIQHCDTDFPYISINLSSFFAIAVYLFL
jgi:hypothetical protein